VDTVHPRWTVLNLITSFVILRFKLERLRIIGGLIGMKLKRLLLMLLLSGSLFSLTGCGNDEEPEEGEKIEDVEEEDEIGDGEVDDE
jgi:hypothetical protein